MQSQPLVYARLLVVGLIFVAAAPQLWGQNSQITTAQSLLDQTAEKYGTIQDYIAEVIITNDSATMRGFFSYLAPDKIRIDFSVPSEQVLVTDGKDLWVYLPAQNVVLQQTMRRSQSSGAAFAGSVGIQLLIDNYSAAFLDSPLPVPLIGTTERVVNIKLTTNSSREHFSELVVSIDTDLFIRRIVGTTSRGQDIQFDFSNIQVNQGVPATRFEYDPPASANLFTDFLFNQ